MLKGRRRATRRRLFSKYTPTLLKYATYVNAMSDRSELIPGITGFGRLTDNARNTIVVAHDIAAENGQSEVMPIHLFIAMLANPSELVARIFDQSGLDIPATKTALEQELRTAGTTASSSSQKPILSQKLKGVINDSFNKAEELQHVYVGMEHLLLSLLNLDGELFVDELKTSGFTDHRVRSILMDLGNYLPGILSQTMSSSLLENPEEEGSLPFFCRDMNQFARDGQFLNITGRDKEIDRLIHILSRKTKNNPILVGDAGVGKTAVVEGLVQRIVRGDVPSSFMDKEVLSLDIASIIAGAKVRGDVEERILMLVNDAIESGNKIIFIDEIHMIIGAGSGGGRDAMDVGNILKPYLTDPKLRIIGATTLTEYRRYFDDEAALSRRFQPVNIEEIDRVSAISILQNLKSDFEKYHGVKIKDEAIVEAVNLSSKFIADRYLPDKAIDLLDEAAASIKIGREITIEPELNKLGEKLVSVQRRKQNAIDKGNLKKASALKIEEEDITEQIEELMEGRQHRGKKSSQVTADLVKKIVVDWTKIPLAAGGTTSSKLKNLRSEIAKKIIGQDQVLDGVVEALKRSHLGLTDQKRPLASFLFLGPTGVGKTQLAKTIASELFGSESLLVQFNMSEYMEQHSVAKLIGSPPGYVGYQEGGQLTEEVRRRPYSVILFDEIEKAHPEILNLLLQILEEGELKDGKGRKALFKNTVVVLTSNIGAEEVSKDKRLGFNVNTNEIETEEMGKAFEEMRDELLQSLQDEVRPEILNRLDEIAVFRGFNMQDCLEISRVMVDELVIKLLEGGISLEVSPSVVKLVNEQGYSKEYGARNIRRKIQELIENGLANFMLEKSIDRPKKGILKLKAKTVGKQIVFSIEKIN